jgi:hypothetical protein
MTFLLNMEAVSASETSGNIYQIIWYYIQEDSHLRTAVRTSNLNFTSTHFIRMVELLK